MGKPGKNMDCKLTKKCLNPISEYYLTHFCKTSMRLAKKLS